MVIYYLYTLVFFKYHYHFNPQFTDNFNVDGVNSSSNLYLKYGAQRKRNPGSYMTTVDVSKDTKYAFIAVDATLDIGPKRMLNFGIGIA